MSKADLAVINGSWVLAHCYKVVSNDHSATLCLDFFGLNAPHHAVKIEREELAKPIVTTWSGYWVWY
jgi:hypothetical protein